MATEQDDSDAQKKLAEDLWKAVHNDDVIKVRSLLGQGADPNHQLYWSDEWADKRPSLHHACRWGYLEIVKTLVTHGARTDKGGGRANKTPLHYACRGGHKEMVEYLIQEVGCSTDVRDKNNWTPLHYACQRGHKEMVKYLILEVGCSTDVRDKNNKTPLHYAYVGGSKDVVQYLVEELKIDVDVRDDEGQSPLDRALENGCVDVALYLMSCGCGGDKDKAKLLCGACYQGRLGLVKELVEQDKVDPNNVRNDAGRSPLDKALDPECLYDNEGCVDVALYLMSRGCGGDEDKAKLLRRACLYGNLDLVKELVEQHKVDPNNVRDNGNWTPLHNACISGYMYKDVVQYLVEKANCDISVTNDAGRTPLDYATQHGYTEIVDYLKSLPQLSAVTGDSDSWSEENGPPPTKKQKVTSDPLSGQQTPSAGNKQPEITDTPNGPKQLPSTDKTSSKSKAVKKSEQALNEAMKAGFVRVNITNLLFFGMAGTGKTSTKHLLLGLPPPVDRNSTPLASTAERICIRQIRDTTKIQMEAQEDPSRTWKPVTSDDLQRIVADAIKSHVTSSDSAIPQELSIALKQLEPINESTTPVDATPSTSRATKPSVAGAKLTQEGKKTKFLSTVSNVMANIQRFSDADRTAVQEKFGSHWIYIIDSGGQPHFHNLLPLFMPKISVALYILRLSDCLDDHPLVEYYKNNKPVGEAFKSHLSVLDNFKYLVQSIQSHSENCKLVCIGTHKDHQSECKETLSDKNKTLLNFVEDDCLKKLTMFFNLGKKDVVFPVDCKHCDSDSTKVAKTIRGCIHKASQELNKNEILVPFWWFVLEIIIEKVSNDENRKVLSKTECVEIAKTLHNFHEVALCEALKFFHDHHIFHYYLAILPNVVFCDTQVLLDKVTELVEYAAYVRKSDDPASGFGTWLDFTDKGIITIELLSENNFEKHYVDGLFAPTHLIEIFKHLLIATPFRLFSQHVTQDKRFYMPSLLSLLPPTQVNAKRVDLLKTGLISLVLHFKSNWQCCGVFCCLQVYLIKECEWEIEMEDHQPSRNFVQFVHQNRNCTITLIDGFSFLEIHSSSDRKDMLSLIYANIHSGLRSAYKALKYTYEDPEFAFLCPHEFPKSPTETNPQVPHHPARVLAEDDVMRCTLCKKMTYKLGKCHKNWLSVCCPSMSVASEVSSQPSVLNNETSVELQPHETIVIATAAQLSSECSDEALLQLSTEIAGYDRYKHRLGLSDAEIDAIDQSPSMVDNIPHAALKKWKSKSIIFDNPSNSTATYGQLVEIAAKIEDKEAIRSIHKACVEHTTQPHATSIATAAQLSQECSDEALLQLSTKIAGYHRYKHRLGLSDAEIDEIDNDPRDFYSTQGKFYTALLKWKSKSIDYNNLSKSSATYSRLVEIAAKIEDGEAVRSIHKACVEHTRLEVMDQSTPSAYTTNT